MTNKATIVSIANELSISPSTVSYVLRGQEKKVGISERTAQRVKDRARQLGYVPNHLARSLQRKRTGLISVLFTGLQLDYAEHITEGIEKVLDVYDYSAIILRHTSRELERDALSNVHSKSMQILARRDEGVICQPHMRFKQDYITLMNANIPVVFIGSLLEDMAGLERVNSVVWDCSKPVELAVNHLIEIGRKKIGFVGSRHGVASDMTRFETYTAVLRSRGLQVNPDWVVWGSGYKTVPFDLVKKMFREPTDRPDAIFALNDSIGITLLEMLADLGLNVPDDVAVIGMGNLSITGFRGVGLSTVEEPQELLGIKAAELILDLINKKCVPPVHRRVEWNKLIARKSTVGR